MADRKLAGTVVVTDADGAPQRFGPADKVPAWAAAKITNPAAWAKSDDDGQALASGVGSGQAEGSSGSRSSSGGSPSGSKTDTVESVLEDVGDDAVKAAEALEAERSKGDKARKTLVDKLEAVVAAAEAGGDDGNGDGNGAGTDGGGGTGS